jgi:TonB-linked outer membrane protein, SusC/RagA family
MKHIILTVTLLLLTVTLAAQTYTIQGTVSDEFGPVIGVSVYIKERPSIGGVTDLSGNFNIRANRGDQVVFRFFGYETQEYLVLQEEKDLKINLKEATTELEEVVVSALQTQRKITSLGAITSVDVKELQTPATSIANLMGGRVAGITTMLGSGEPGKNIAEFWVRGIGTFGGNASALVLIDGLEGDLNSIDAADVESFSVLKDASATAVYGVRGANGVILVTTKRGVADRIQLTARATFGISQVKRLPEYMGAREYAVLANEARAVRGEERLYSDVEMNIIQNGLDRDLYPNMNWQDEVMRDLSYSQKYYISARGGASIAKYFISLGTSMEDAAYKVDKNSLYSSNVGYNTYNYRVNLDMELTPTTKVYFGTDGFLSVTNRPGTANTDNIWAAQAQLNPLLLPKQYSNGRYPAVGADAGTSPFVQINQMGKQSDQAYSGKVTLYLDQKLDFITPGLNVKVQGAYDNKSWFNEQRLMNPALYEAVGRTQTGELVTIQRVSSRNSMYGKTTDYYRKYHFEAVTNYEKLAGADKEHRISALLYYIMYDEHRASSGTSNMSAIPSRYQGVSGKIAYGYKDTYMIDFNFGYTGSENFEPGNQFGFFPSIAFGWVPTNYELIKETIPFLNSLKLRGSYGTVGETELNVSFRRFPYLTTVGWITANPWGAQGVEGLVESYTGADNLLWEKSTKLNVGMDAKLFRKLDLTVDFYRDRRENIFQQRVQVPMYVGLSTMPFSNVGEMLSWGSDGNISFNQNLNRDMSVTFRGNYTFAQNSIVNWEEANPAYPYQERSGYPYNAIIGYQSLGLFKDQLDIDTSPIQTFGTYQPGDIKYKDVNGDGVINSDDRIPLSFSSGMPAIMYGFGGEFRYKDLSVGLLFKGTGRTDYTTVGGGYEMGYVPFYGGKSGNVLTLVGDPKNRWIPMDYALANNIDPALAENPNARFPRLSYGPNNNNRQLSDFWMADARYLRLQEININYNWKRDFLKKMGINSIDVQLVANDLAVWSKVKEFDPEQARYNGQRYPIPTRYTLQMYINF